jgi:hypothetical protein
VPSALICGLKRQLQSELNIPRWTSRRDLSESTVVQVRFQVAEIRAVESVEDVSLELKFELLCESEPPAQRKIPRLSTGPQNRSYSAGAAPRVGRWRKSRAIDPIVWTPLAIRNQLLAAETISTAISER